MENKEGITMYQSDGSNIEEALFAQEEIEQEEEATTENAKLIFSPKFIPFYPKLLEYGLSITECLVFGFIDFYLQEASSRFYFTNEQLGSIFQLGGQSISNSIKKLKDKGLINVNYKMKANGGTMRYIEKLYSDYKNFYNPTIKKFIPNNNKKKDNKKKEIISKDITKQKVLVSKKRDDIDFLINELKRICDKYSIAYDKSKDRMFAKHICDSKEFGDFCEKVEQNRILFATNILLASLKINYWKGPCSGPMKIYQNYVEVYNQTKLLNKKELEKQKKNTITEF